MRTSLKVIYVVIFLIGFFFNCISQNKKVKFEHLNIKDGLSQNSVISIIQDSKGFLWFGTQGGLNRYDGYDFRIYKNDPKDSTTISGNWINDICEDNFGFLWIATSNGISKYDSRCNKFIQKKYLAAKGLFHKTINVLFKDTSGNIWIGSREGLGKLIIDEKGNEKYFFFSPEIKEFNFLKKHNITAITQDKKGDIWIGTHSTSLFRITITTLETGNYTYKIKHYSKSKNIHSISDNHITKLYSDPKGNLWIGTDNGLNKYNFETDDFNFYNFGKKEKVFHSEQIRGIYMDSKDNLWVGTYANGLFRYNLENDTFEHFLHFSNDSYSLGNDDLIKAIYEDKTGIIWIGSLLGGVNKYDSDKFKFKHYQHQAQNPKSLNNNIIRGFYKDKRGYVWIGTSNGGLNRLDPKTDEFEHFPKKNSVTSKLPTNRLYSIMGDKDDNLWVGTMFEGLYKITINRNGDPIGLKKYFPDHNNPNSLTSSKISNIFRYNEDELWVCSFDGSLSKYIPNKDRFEIMLHTWRDSLGVLYQRPQCVEVDQKGNIWLGSIEGLICFDPKRKKIINKYLNDPNNPYGIIAAQIKYIHQTTDGILWLGSNKGLIKFDPKKETFQLFNEDDGLPSEMVYAVLEDDKGQFWMSTNGGICKFNPYDFSTKTYDISDGLQENEFNTWSYHKSYDGEFFFGGINGFNSFYPEDIVDNQLAPDVIITEFKLFNEKVLIKDKNSNIDSPLSADISELNEITLSHNDYVISFEFTALHFTAPKSNKYAYKLEGFDSDWNYRDWTRRYINYTNLSPGEYTLRIKASNHDNVWNENGTSLLINIIPPFYKTIWFTILSVSAIIIIIISGFKIRTLQLKNREKVLQKEVAEKTKVLRLQNEEIAKQAEKLKQANRNIQAFNANIFTQNEEITSQNEEIISQNEKLSIQRDDISNKAKELLKAKNIIKEQNVKLQNSNVELEDKVKKRTIELQYALRELDHFVYRSAHDLRGPIARLLGLCNIGKLETADTKAIDNFERIEKVSKDLGLVLQRLVRVQEIKDKKVEQSEVNLTELIPEILKDLSTFNYLSKEHSDIIISGNLIVKTDIKLITILIENIILNAIQFRNETNPFCFLKISSQKVDSDTIKINFEDNGMGMPEQILDKIFDMFFIGTERSKGPGLGLYEAKIIAKKLKSTIILKSSSKSGSQFELSIPIID